MKFIFQFIIKLKGSTPEIWRRIQVSAETSFSELHHIIQLAMGWENAHQYEFKLNEILIYDFLDVLDDRINPFERDSEDTFLNEFITMKNPKFTYVYDFGDSWEHEILLEKVLPDDGIKKYPYCVDGACACPPEDCGGIWRYQEILNILKDKDHPEYDDIITWIGENWDATYFNRRRTNALLRDYGEQLDEIYDDTGNILKNLEENDEISDLDELYEDMEDYEYDEVKKFSSPEDVLGDTYRYSHMEFWVETALEEKNSPEYKTFERLRKLDYDEATAQNLIIKALSVEWFYDLKNGTDILENRYDYNLKNLPDTPQELPRLKDALEVLDRCVKGIPFSAIEYLQNDTSREAREAIIEALKNHVDHRYCWADCELAPYWYSLAAEGHICKELIDPVIQLYEENPRDSEWICLQGHYLIGKLAEKYPDLTTEKVLEAMEQDVKNETKPELYFLFDTFYFCDRDKFKSRLLTYLDKSELSWYLPYADVISDLHITEGLPFFKQKLAQMHEENDGSFLHHQNIIDLDYAIKVLEGKVKKKPYSIKPQCLIRTISWQEDLKMNESLFYEEEHFNIPTATNEDIEDLLTWPGFEKEKPSTKSKKPGRNDPCPCGSGKKYKNCCLDKDELGNK